MKFPRSLRVAAGLSLVVLLWGGASARADEDGKAVYEKSCMSCHSIKGEGGKMKNVGGALDGVGAKRDADYLKAYVSDPKSKLENAKMPKVKLAPEQLDAVVQYLLTLK